VDRTAGWLRGLIISIGRPLPPEISYQPQGFI